MQTSDFLFNERVNDYPSPLSRFEERMIYIENKTGLRNIKQEFELSDIYDETDILLHFILRKYDINELNQTTLLISMFHVFSNEALRLIGADKEEYYNMTGSESITCILNKILNTKNDVNTTNGFPSSFNHSNKNNNIINRDSNGSYWLPISNTNSIDYGSLLNYVVRKLNVDLSKNRMLYHGISFDSALSINDEIEIIPRQVATDFGMRNFYVTDVFYTACSWVRRDNNQSAVVVFVIPNELFSTNNRLLFNVDYNLDKWKETVFKARFKPRGDLSNDKREYKKFLHNLDSKDYIEGPIYANPGDKNVNSVNYISYNRNGNVVVPKQISFKDSMIPLLNSYILITLYFEDTR